MSCKPSHQDGVSARQQQVRRRVVAEARGGAGLDTATLRLGSARVSRVGFGVSPKQAFLTTSPTCSRDENKVRDSETPLPTRETRALPRNDPLDFSAAKMDVFCEQD